MMSRDKQGKLCPHWPIVMSVDTICSKPPVVLVVLVLYYEWEHV